MKESSYTWTTLWSKLNLGKNVHVISRNGGSIYEDYTCYLLGSEALVREDPLVPLLAHTR
jgi:hypothetical protein